MAQAKRDENRIPTLLGVSNVDGVTPTTVYADPVTHRLLVDLPGGGGTVTSFSFTDANGFAGVVTDPTTTPNLTLSTTITGLVKGNGTALLAATANVDYQTALSLTTTGTSGPATLVGGNLNIPEYAAGTGDVVGPASSTDNALSRFDGTTGKLIQNSTLIGSDAGDLTIPRGLRVGFAGTGDDDEIQIGDANFSLDYLGGSIPTLFFDTSDGLSYARTNNEFDFLVSSAPVMRVAATSVQPGSNDGSSLGIGAQAWSDLFLASGAVQNWNNGNVILTHTSGILTLNPGDLRVTTAGTNTASVVTVGGTQDLTNKTLTAPVLSGTITGTYTIGGTPTFPSTVTQNASAQTLTNKRNQPRTASSTTSATLTPDLSTANVYFRTTQTEALTIGAPSGTPVIGETIAIYVDSAGAQTLTMNATYVAFGSAFPASTTAGKTLMIVAQYNGTNWKTTWQNAA